MGRIKKAKITYRGWAGHFICSHRCQFRLNTLIEFDETRIVVSTVGAMEFNGSFKEVGYKRHFETMAFHAKLFDGRFWDSDISKQVWFLGPWSFPNLEDEIKANDNHIRIVKQIATALENGEKFLKHMEE